MEDEEHPGRFSPVLMLPCLVNLMLMTKVVTVRLIERIGSGIGSEWAPVPE
jgi:hypothetical protein